MGSMKDLLGDTPYPATPGYERESITSRIAAETMISSAAGVRERVFSFIDVQGRLGATSDEAERRLNLRHQTCSARFRELALAGRIVKANRRRNTSSGRPAEVFVSLQYQGVAQSSSAQAREA